MFPFSLCLWLPVRFRRQRAAKAVCTRKKLRQRSFRPWCEPLEDRWLPSTLMVLNTNDSGPDSLRAAITAADGTSGDVIEFAPGLHGTITLTSGELDITSTMTIDGPGANNLTVSGNNASRIFNIGNDATATISGLTVANGASINTGEDADGNIIDATKLGGGGILNQAGSTLILTCSVLADNTTTASADVDSFGGGLLNEGTANISSSIFRGNKALAGAGAFFGGSVGGAINNFSGADLTVTGSTFIGNQAIGADGNFGGLGGAIESDLGSTANIRGSLFINNLASGGRESTANGGAIDNEYADMILTDSTLIGNRAVGGAYTDGETNFGQALGGGILNAFGTLDMSRDLLVGNQAIGGDHGTATVDNPLAGGAIGGGIVNIVATLKLEDSTLAGNVARGGATDAGPGSSGVGGGIENYWGSTLTIMHSALVGNAAVGGQGGAGNNGVPAGFGIGGGIDVSSNPDYGLISHTTIIDSIIAGNVAIGSNGRSGANGGTGMGGGISVGSNAILGYDDGSQLTITHSTVEHNAAIGGKGGSGADGGDGLGGGIVVFTNSTANANGSTVEFNLAIGGLKGQGGDNGSGLGGGVYTFAGGTFNADFTTVIKKNYASTSNDDIYP